MSTSQIPNSPYLDEIIECVKEVRIKQPISCLSSFRTSGINLQNLYDEAGEMIKNFQTNINRCKRYNQAKINRKYQIIIHDLQNQIKKLTNRLKIQQDSKSPTKKYITNLLDQLVLYKDQNQKLKIKIYQYKKHLQQLYNKNTQQNNVIKKIQDTHPKILIQRLPACNNVHTNIVDTIKQYLKNKQQIRKIICHSEKSNFQKFLSSVQTKSWNWNINTLLQQIDKWSTGIKPTKQIDMLKIRSSVAKNFFQYLDDSSSLTKPSSLNKKIYPITPISITSRKQIQSHKKQMSKISNDGESKSKDKS